MRRLVICSALAFPLVALGQAKEQFVPINSYWVGPYAPASMCTSSLLACADRLRPFS